MKVQFELAIGENKFTLIEDVDTHTDFFKKLNFYSTLPKTGPNGETDLVLRHRLATTKAGKKVDYYSIVSEKAKQEFKFGQSQQISSALFPKGWEPLYNAGDDAESADDNGQASLSGTSVGLGGIGATQSMPSAATSTPANANAGLGAPAQKAPTPAPAVQIQAPVAASAVANPAVQKNAANILSKFGI
jgi:hypothetical protein